MAETPKQDKPPSRRLTIFVPEGNREFDAIPVELHDRWTVRMLEFCTQQFGGATAYGRGIGLWLQGKKQKSKAHWDRITVIESWVSPEVDLDELIDTVTRKLQPMRRALKQEEVGFTVDGRFYSAKKLKRRRKH